MKNAFDPQLYDAPSTFLKDDSPSFGETLKASLGFQYNPVIDSIRQMKYGFKRDENFVAADNIPNDMKEFGSTLLYAVNKDHMNDMILSLKQNINRREVLSRSSFLSQIGAGILDPINLVSLPFGGPAVSVGRSAARVGLGAAALQSGAELMRAPVDPLYTPSESILNIGGAAIFGGLIGGLASIPMTRRANAIANGIDATDEMTRALSGLAPEDIQTMGPREQRKFAGLTDEELELRRKELLIAKPTQVDAPSLVPRVEPTAEAPLILTPEQRVDGGPLILRQDQRVNLTVDALKEVELERTIRRMEDVQSGKISPDLSIASSLYTDSWIYKGITTPMKRLLQNENVPNTVKGIAQAIAGDSGILLKAHQAGIKIKNSIYQDSKLLEGEFVQQYDKLINMWGKASGRDVVAPLDYNVSNMVQKLKRGDTFEDWLADIDYKYITRAENLTDIEKQAVNVFDGFYKTWEKRLSDTGMIGSKASYEKYAFDRQLRIADAEARLAKAKNPSHVKRLQSNLELYRRQLDEANLTIKDLSERPILPKNEEVFRPRYWDRDSIKNNRVQFEEILYKWFSENPANVVVREADGSLKTVDLSTDPAAIGQRVTDMVDNLLGLKGKTDDFDPDNMFFGSGKSKHMKHRVVDVPNELVMDFIERNPIKVMKAYVRRVGPKYEFAKRFNGRSYEDVADDIYNEMITAGRTQEEAYAAIKDITTLYDRVVGTVLKEPDAWSNRIAQGLKTAAQLNYLGSAGLSTLTEPAKIVMEHGLMPTIKALEAILTDSKVRLAAREGRIAGEILEIINGSSGMRLSEEMTNNPLATTFWDKAKDGFYALNLLAPATSILKKFDAIVRQHTLIDYSIRWTQGRATKMEQEYLLRYNVNFDDASKIANAPHQQTSNGLYLANTEAWTNAIEFPATTANIVVGPTGKTLKGRYRPAFFRPGKKGEVGTIHIDEDYLMEYFHSKPWTDPKIKGVEPLPDDAFKTPQEFVTFVKMHEIMHTLKSAEDLNLTKPQKIKTADGEIEISAQAAYENKINELAMDEINKQKLVDPETVKTFRNAMQSGIMNTILMGTPADKPAILDGVAYIPMRVAKNFGMTEDARVKGYARIENGLLSLPFQFYSYSLAAVNKVTAAYAHGQVKGRMAGALLSLGLGYMLYNIKTPDWAQKESTYQDRFARAFDYSGLASLYSDIFYTSMATALALGGENFTGGGIQPRFPQKPSTLDAITGIAGAGPSIAADYGKGLYEMVTGNIGEGAGQVLKSLPFARILFWKDEVNQMSRALGGGRY